MPPGRERKDTERVKTGITGLPFSGKTTLFCALTGQDYGSLGHGREIHPGTVPVPDRRLDVLFDLFQPRKKTPATMEYFDIAGKPALEKGGMDTAVIRTLRNADSLVVVLDAFSPGADPRRDLAALIEEFALSDLVVATNRLERIEKELRAQKDERLVHERELMESVRERLEGGERLTGMAMTESQDKALRGFQFLTRKPILAVVNISEADLEAGRAEQYEKQFADTGNIHAAAICAEVEMEIAALDNPEERAEFLASMGIEESAMGRLIHLSYESLGLLSFFTAGGDDEVRAWTVRQGAKAPECAGVIHSDMERGFIRAETIAFDDLVLAGSLKAAREKGLLRIEGREYIVNDGDILTIRFNV